MTKRVLSMLMALIMALSLCVPAFAADEPVSADEPAAEVEAPAAEAEETEAEAEPVEEAVDAPEAAAVDEPALVALGVVTKQAHYDLEQAIAAAEELLPDVQAGKLRPTDSNPDVSTLSADDLAAYAKDPVEGDPFEIAKNAAALEEAIALAKKYDEGVHGADVDVDVTTSTIDSKITGATGALGVYLEGAKELVKTTSANMTTTKLETLLKKGDEHKGSSTVTLETRADDLDVTTNAAWTKTYQPGYLTKLQAAIDAYDAYVALSASSQTYEQFVKAAKVVLDAIIAEEAAAKPVAGDMSKLDAAIAKAEAAEALGDDYDQSAYVNGKQLGNVGAAAGDGSLRALIAKAKELKASKTTGTVQFSDDATLWDLNAVVEAIDNALVKVGGTTIAYETYAKDQENKKLNVTFSIDQIAGSTTTDGHTYGIAWQVQKKGAEKALWHPNGATKGAEEFSEDYIVTLSGWGVGSGVYAGKLTKVQEVENIGESEADEFADDDKVIIHIYEQTNSERTPWRELTTVTITVAEPPVVWPTIEETEIAVTGGSVEELSTKALVGSGHWGSTPPYTGTDAATITITLSEAVSAAIKAAYDVQLVVRVGKDVVATAAEAKFSTATVTIDSSIVDKYLTAGDSAIVELQSTGEGTASSGPAWTTRATAKLEVKALSKWSATENIQDVLDAIDALIESDYVLTAEDVPALEEDTVAEAFGIIESDCSTISANIKSTTLGDTPTNRKATGDLLNDVATVLGYLKVKASDQAAFNDLMDEIQALVAGLEEQDGTGTYTFDTLGKLNEVYGYYDASGDGEITAGSTQSAVDAAIEALQDALDGLVKIGEIDKSELEASIAAAEALNEEDYTPESWADLEDAIEAAKAVLEDEDATQAQLTNAADKLNKAVAALVKRDLTTEDLEEAIAAAEAAIADPSKYTDESVLAVQDAITAAKALGDDATAAEIQEAIDKLDAAVKGLVPAEAEPELKEGWNLIEGEYYYCKDGKMVKSDWVKSKGLWYHMGADGTMDTGFIHIVDDWGDGWYYLEPSNAKGTEGRMRTGWQEINDATAGHWGWFETRSNGHQGMCTYTSAQGDYKDYKPVK